MKAYQIKVLVDETGSDILFEEIIARLHKLMMDTGTGHCDWFDIKMIDPEPILKHLEEEEKEDEEFCKEMEDET